MVGRPGAAGFYDFGPDQGVDQGALAGAGAAEHGDDQGGLDTDPQRRRPIGQPTHQRPALFGRLPGGRFIAPAAQPIDQCIDFGQKFKMCKFGTGHGSSIPAAIGNGEGEKAEEPQSPWSGPFFGSQVLRWPLLKGRKHGPDPFRARRSPAFVTARVLHHPFRSQVQLVLQR